MRVACNHKLDGGCLATIGKRARVSRQIRTPPSSSAKENISLKPGKHRAPARRPSLIAYSNQDALTTIPRQHRVTSDDEIVELYKDIGQMAQSRRSQGLPIDSEEMSMWEECRLCAMDDIDATTPFRISNIVYRCRKGQYYDIELFDALFRKARTDPEFMGKFHPIGVSMSIQSMGTMAKYARMDGNRRALRFFETSGADFVVDLMRASVEDGLLKKRDFGTKELSNALHGLGLYVKAMPLDKAVVHSFVQAACSEFLVKGGTDIHPLDFNSLLLGCAKCKFAERDSIEPIAAMLERRLKKGSITLTARDLSILIWSLGKLKYSNVRLMNKLSKMALKQKFGPRGIAMISYGCAAIGYKNPPLLLVLAKQLSDPNELKKFNEQELASTVYSLFGLLRYSNPQLVSAVGSEIVKEKRLKKFSEQGLCTIVYGLRVARFKDIDVLKPLANEVKQPHRLEKLQTATMGNLVLGFAMVDYPDALFFDALGEEAIKPHRLAEYPKETLATMLFGFKWVGRCKKEVLAALACGVARGDRLREFTSPALAGVVDSLGFLGLEDEHVWDAMQAEVLREERLLEFSQDCLMKLWKGIPRKDRYQKVVHVLEEQISNTEFSEKKKKKRKK
ncbi:hypothetical protein BSKO_11796 [Bryopsis sp. KO-2023]|nr:hypothetical protein BSKO_11796 [Bryopsis sp. KO-2023]